MSYYEAVMAFEDVYTRKFLDALDPTVRGLMQDAFCRAYQMGEVDARRWRFAMDEGIQDKFSEPVALAVGIMDDDRVVRWGVTWDINADAHVDRMIGVYERNKRDRHG